MMAQRLLGVALLLALTMAPGRPVAGESWWQKEITRFRTAPHMATLRESRNAGDWKTALAAADRILAIDPGNQDARLQKLEILYEHQRYDDALVMVTGIPSTSAVYPRTRFIEALIYYERGQMKKARGLLALAANDENLAKADRSRSEDLLARIALAEGFIAASVHSKPAYAEAAVLSDGILIASLYTEDVLSGRLPGPRHRRPPAQPSPINVMEEVFRALSENRAEDALNALDKAAAEDAGPIVQLYRGYAFLQLEQHVPAEAAFGQAATAETLDARTRATAWAQAGYLAVARTDHQAAMNAFQRSIELAGPSPELLLQLGYAQAAALKWREAVATLERAAALDGGSVQLSQDIAYAARNAGADDKAALWFRRALDDGGELSRERELAIKQEVEWLEDRLDISLYSAFRGNTVDGGGLSPLERSLLQSQGGLGMRYIPPGMGRETGRFTALTGRLLWSYEHDSLAVSSASWQGGLGLSLRPLPRDNLVLGAERLIPIGRDARSDWLFRAGYSWSRTGNKLPWPDAKLYVDTAVIDPGSPDILATADLQVGRKMKPHRWLSLWPHLLLAGNWQDDDYGSVSLLEGGAGFTTTLNFDEGQYRAYRASISLSLGYRFKLAGNSVGKSGPLLVVSVRR